MNEQLTIGTPENVSFGYPIAGIGSRFVAALVDSSLITFLLMLTYGTLFIILAVGGDIENQVTALAGISNWLIAGLSLLSFVFLWGYYIFFEMAWNGQSPGKRLMKLRVVRADGGAVALTESIIRNLIRLIDFLPVAYGVGVVTMFVNAHSRRMGDLAAGTLVVHDRLGVTLDSLGRRPSPTRYRYNDDKLSPIGLPLDRLTPADLQIAQEFLLREEELTLRDQLADQILKFLYEQMEQPPPALARGQAAVHLAAILQEAAELEK